MGQSVNYSAIRFYVQNLFSFRKQLFKPKLVVSDMRDIPYDDLKAKGFAAIAFDKDNTLTAPYCNTIHDPFHEKWEECKNIFGRDNVVIVSNSAGSFDDVGYQQAKEIESACGVKILRHSSGKKKPEGGQELMRHFGLNDGEKIIVVGDRILTDIVYANNIGAYSILCKNIITKRGDNKIASMVSKCLVFLFI
jgi:phosphatidylglycerophosphatase GEP4